jgi:hypothetical protein
MTNDDYKRGYREGYQDGMDAARKLLDPYLPIAPVLPTVPSRTCRVCGIDLSKATGYVCYNGSCPSRVVWKSSEVK